MKIWCEHCKGLGFTLELSDDPHDFPDVYYETTCPKCKGKKWYEHPTCNQCDEFYLDEQGYPSKVSMCRVLGICVNPSGYCFVHSELLEEK